MGKLKYLPGFWGTTVPWIIASVLAAIFPGFLSSLIIAVQSTPRLVFVGIQCMRILAVLSIIKARQGLFPPILARTLAWPDLLFGISAWCVLALELFGIPLTATSFAMW